ncbi:MAG: glycine cleavage system aminomethyltransferase GcvT [Candidatus Saliniplasma sp.]
MKETALCKLHEEAGAKMTKFAGYRMPLKFTSITKEHMAVRKKAGLFDVSHMGEILIKGEGAIEFISKHLTQDISDSEINEVKYAHILNKDGGILDDTLVSRLTEDSCYIVPNAGNNERIYDWLADNGGGDYLTDITYDTVMLALQGPEAQRILSSICKEDISDIEFFRSKQLEINDKVMNTFDDSWPMLDKPLIQRSGYTGEDGFEIVVPEEAGRTLWEQILSVEDPPARCGLGARDTLRLEFGFLLSGQDFDESRTTVETGWGEHAVDWEHDFVGKKALEEVKGTDHQMLRGMIMQDKGIPRSGYSVYDADEKIGEVTSGTRSPILKKGIAMGYLDSGYHEEGTEVQIEIRGEKKKAKVKNPPFISNE